MDPEKTIELLEHKLARYHVEVEQYMDRLTDMTRERDEALAELDWLTMRGTDELPSSDWQTGEITKELTGDALVEYLRAQRRSERERAEKAERERDEAREQVALLVAAMDRTRWGYAPPEAPQ